MTVSALSPLSMQTFFYDTGGAIRPSRLFFYHPDTTDPLTVYTDHLLSVPHDVPVLKPTEPPLIRLRGRYVERGMGITADLLSRYDGSIAVEPEPGWQKAVVLRFFTVEEGP